MFCLSISFSKKKKKKKERQEKIKGKYAVVFFFFSFLFWRKIMGKEGVVYIYIYIPHNTMSISGFHSFDILIFRMPGGVMSVLKHIGSERVAEGGNKKREDI